MNDDDFLALMDALWGVGGGDSLWAIAMSDDDPEPAVIDPAMEARAARDIGAAGDLLMPPPFEGPLPPGRDDYQPRIDIDPDEEVTW